MRGWRSWFSSTTTFECSKNKCKPKDTNPILLDTIDLESDWVVEEESPDLSWVDEETGYLSSFPSQMETPNTPTTQLLQPYDVSTSSMRAYCRRSHP